MIYYSNKAAYSYMLTPRGIEKNRICWCSFYGAKRANTNCWSRKSPDSLGSWTHTTQPNHWIVHDAD
jgi:hypothetical protein